MTDSNLDLRNKIYLSVLESAKNVIDLKVVEPELMNRLLEPELMNRLLNQRLEFANYIRKFLIDQEIPISLEAAELLKELEHLTNREAIKSLTGLGDDYRNTWFDFDGRTFRDEVYEIAKNIVGKDEAKKKLIKLGDEYRDDWSQVDGRTIKLELYQIANMLE